MFLIRFEELMRMPIARIIMTEQNTPEAQEQLLDDHREEVRNLSLIHI